MALPTDPTAPIDDAAQADQPPDDTSAPDDGTVTIALHVHPDGTFTLDEDPTVLDTPEQALKAVLRAIRSHAPEGATPREQMAAGYGPTDAQR